MDPRSSFFDLLRRSRLLSDADLTAHVPAHADPDHAVALLVEAGALTPYQVRRLKAGKTTGYFLGPYKLLGPLGEGGMGAVYLAEHTTLGRKVALKTLPKERAKDALTFERFRREARAAAALDHPNIVRIHDLCHEAGVHFLVLEYVDGTDLQSLLADGPLPYPLAVRYVREAAGGLQHAHERGFIHRDIKPANLILPRAGGVKILDMGLTRSLTEPSDQLTGKFSHGLIAGTVDYLAPEQALGLPQDERTDLYSLGATLYALLTGRPPFSGDTAQRLTHHQMSEPKSVRLRVGEAVPQELSDLVGRMMAKHPDARPPSAAVVRELLARWQADPTPAGVSEPTPLPGALSTGHTRPLRRPAATPRRRTRWRLIAVAAALLAGLAAVPILFSPTRPAKPSEREVFALDLSGQQPFRERRTVADGLGCRVLAKQGDSGLPDNWLGLTWRAGDEVEFFADELGGIGFATVKGDPSVMLISPAFDLPDGRVRAAVEYRTEPGDVAAVLVKFQQTMPEAVEAWEAYTLPPTEGEWRQREFELLRRGATAGRIEFHNTGLGGAVRVRAVRLVAR